MGDDDVAALAIANGSGMYKAVLFKEDSSRPCFPSIAGHRDQVHYIDALVKNGESRKKQSFSIIILITVMFAPNVDAFGTCEISKLTLRFVDKCPEDEVSWTRSAERLDCRSITQSCADSLGPSFKSRNYIFQYHCVINDWRNATMEVCALNRTILGFCTEFDIQGAVIQDNYDADCTQHTPPCPKSYNSAEAYKYPSCYDLVNRNRKTITHASSSWRIGVHTFLFTLCFLRHLVSTWILA